MEVSIALADHEDFLEPLQIEREIGQGKSKVYNAYSPSQKINYALKVFPNSPAGGIYYQKEKIISQLHHPNIIKTVPIIGNNTGFSCLLTELAQYGDFLNLTMKKAFHSEAVIRTYFHQLIEGIEYLHSQGIAHLDLKLDNLVLGSDFKLKIIDFDQAQSLKDSKPKCGGSANYRPPEVIDKRCKNLGAVDVYSAGIILYTLIAREFPFHETIDSKGIRLQHFSTFVKDKTKFWTLKAGRLQDKDVFGDELIELLNEMLEYDAEKRIKIEDIKKSKWYQGPVVDEEDLVAQMKEAVDKIDQESD